ncbi:MULTISPECIES: tRNA (cytidine(34)-2'-O)-methyltransferase [unclassified Campylobacter]|uniref:tRNA (cytidine(34)-2'-O)-methyltransferase n=1 Tax=unclassified Campylobacter TaxID=2593542 RepID=UPI0012381B31|nr:MULTISPECIES: tRNA (cytidine(34)-2'-O)-methyltransferase [unclassified Campylobacter]KAA6224736.1 tRNA (cytidine(34)-2'-O)-methyltransferase [Campylobacter sp. LR185c]KAA6225733.1 tRNA (cytidine(34)-2'-O)-methyltransferase [Campylobacter sp. LR286c]KAA6225854.1 tRNA (cytidine(34)-2'-O)-methyltransferase [Campylobacter sp. LR196d]KAA6229706.1 tRNA (cytidine(34)-2'-O)-methyltransferase [Campylobacter sp. LR291e]KAA8603924.1 RNA methyltransferase [Campylobacter sp. LR185c]
MFNIVLVNPRIPQNTGSIGRMCFNAGFTLHIIKPTIFDISNKALKRAGLDYWAKLEPIIWENLDEFLAKNLAFQQQFFFATTKGVKAYFEVKFKEGDYLFFGSESFGLPLSLMDLNKENMIKIPMKECGRSLNLATSVGIISYEALRQNFTYFKA